MFTVKITYCGNVYTYPKDTTLIEISNSFKEDFKYDIIIGAINNKLTELNTKVENDCTIDFYDVSHLLGNRVYERGLIYLFIHAVNDVLGCDVRVEHSIDKGIYIELLCGKELDENILTDISNQMNKLVGYKIPFEKMSVSRLEAIDYFNSNGQKEKAHCLKYISNTYVNLYKFDNLYDYFYGEMPVDTSSLKYFKLTLIKPNGIVLCYPNLYINAEIADYVNHEKLFKEFENYHDWCETLKITDVSDLNDYASDGNSDSLIYLSELEQNSRLYDLAKHIKENSEIKIVLIAGPSSSGKTTTSKKLSLYLRSLGLSPYPLSIDDYFLDRENTPKKENGEFDFESLKAINVELLNSNLKQLLNGEEITCPQYDFLTGKCELKDKKLKLNKSDILIIEGLHALNDDLTSSIDKNNKYKIYLSPLTSINIDNHNRIGTSDNRLLRRIIRDNKYRGYSASTTLGMWQNVREGEEKNVFPYQDNSDVIFNTSLIYELGVLRLYVEPLLFSVSETDPNYGEAIRLINLLRNVLPITSNKIPLDSIIREFIGDSYFKE